MQNEKYWTPDQWDFGMRKPEQKIERPFLIPIKFIITSHGVGFSVFSQTCDVWRISWQHANEFNGKNGADETSQHALVMKMKQTLK